MPRKTPVNHAGERYGRLVMKEFHHRGNRRESYWLCDCDCGGFVVASWGNIRSGDIKSCGCLNNEVRGDARRTHGKTGTRTYRIWKAMVARCQNEKNNSWLRYGGRGISVCSDWRNSFEAFLADMGEAPPRLSIDRIDNDGNYEPANCRWASPAQQSRNTTRNRFIKIGDERRAITDWGNLAGLSKNVIARRLKRGVAPEIAVTARCRVITGRLGRPSKQRESEDA